MAGASATTSHEEAAGRRTRKFSMTRDEIVTGLRDLLRKQKQLKVDPDSVTLETRFDQIGFDSLSILDFMYDVETKYGAFPEMSELVRMQRVSDLIDYLLKHVVK
jgi:acyl carrier protein